MYIYHPIAGYCNYAIEQQPLITTSINHEVFDELVIREQEILASFLKEDARARN
jgi:hypothetical protein